jgi:2-polyprenyl-3-methyl-5-hydroxy-6-metoxy-1,4-benzoquinol methylase
MLIQKMTTIKLIYDNRFKEVSMARNSYSFGSLADSFDYFCKLNIPTDARILDLGSNIGEFINALYSNGWKNVFGLDVCEKAVEKGRAEYSKLENRLILYDGKTIPFANYEFDVVTMFNVLEHIHDLGSFLRKQIIRVLKPGGMIIFQTPNKYLDIFYESIKFKSFAKWKSIHCSLQTPSSLKTLLDECGFIRVQIEKVKISNSTYYKRKAEKYLGSYMAPVFVSLLDCLPFFLTPVIFGHARKPL